MNEQRLRELLRDVPVPEERESEERGLRLVRAGYERRPQPPRRPRLGRLAVALAVGLLLGALVLSPAGAGVRDWIDEVFEAGVDDAEPALTRLPGGGRLLVDSSQGPWLVQPDGSRRLLGNYEQAGWSPRGLFVIASGEGTLTALEPDGDPRWSLSQASPISDARWSPSGFRIGYRAGRSLRVVAGDGTGDRLLAPAAAAVAPSWWPGTAHLLAYVDSEGAIRAVNADTGAGLGSTPALPGVESLAFAPEGSLLLEVSSDSIRIRALAPWKTGGKLAFGAARRLPIPAGAAVRGAVFAPSGEAIAMLITLPASPQRPPHSELLIAGAEGTKARRVFAAPGHFEDLAWSPDGRRILVSWREADQWLFIPATGGGRATAVDRISSQFSPGEGESRFPSVAADAWCCPR